MNVKKISLVLVITLLVGATLTGFFTSVKGETGERLWTHSEHSDIVRSVYVSDGIVYSGGDDNEVIAYDTEDESVLWTHSEHSNNVRSVHESDGIVYSGGDDNEVIAYDTEDESVLWTHSEHSNSVEAVHESDGIVYSGDDDNEVIAYDTEDESVLWTHSEHSDGVRSVYVSDGIVYSGGRDGTVIAYDTEDESVLWTHSKHSGTVWSVHESDGIVYSGAFGDTVIAYNNENESVLWEHEEHSDTVRSVHESDGIVYSGGDDDEVIAYDDPYNDGSSEEETENHSLEIDTKGNGTTDPGTGTHSYENGTEVNITASPDSGYNFVNWTGDISSENKTETITMDQDFNITANFEEEPEDPENYTLEINIEGNGTVELDPDQDNYTEGTEVELTAIPGDNATFSSWSGELGSQDDLEIETITVVMDKNRSITATFEETEDRLMETLSEAQKIALAGGFGIMMLIFIVVFAGKNNKGGKW